MASTWFNDKLERTSNNLEFVPLRSNNPRGNSIGPILDLLANSHQFESPQAIEGLSGH